MDQIRQQSDPVRGAAPPVYGDAAARARDRVNAAGPDEGIGALVAGLIGDLQEIVRGEVRLAKAELRLDATTIGRASGMLAAGALLGLVGFTFLMLAVAYVLHEEADLDRWLAVGIVAVALLVLAAILALVGKNRLSAANLKPEQTIASLKEDQAWAKDQINSVKR
jgi:uncharacterized membrane protein YqjE